MTHWTEPPETEELALSKPRLWMNGPSSYEERYAQPNDGYIEVTNDSSDDEDKQEHEKSNGGLIADMKERVKKIDGEKRSPKLRKSNK
jgi:hypothetical protein